MPSEPHLDVLLTQPEPDTLGVQAFLDSFGEAITAGDGAAIAQLWETPAFVLSEAMERVVASREEIAEFFGGARGQYNEMGVVDTRAEIVRLDEITDKLVIVRVRWPYLDKDGKEVGAECSTYTLRRAADGEWRLRIAVMHGQEALN
jgi:ketosteroid isomerase-like protein